MWTCAEESEKERDYYQFAKFFLLSLLVIFTLVYVVACQWDCEISLSRIKKKRAIIKRQTATGDQQKTLSTNKLIFEADYYCPSMTGLRSASVLEIDVDDWAETRSKNGPQRTKKSIFRDTKNHRSTHILTRHHFLSRRGKKGTFIETTKMRLISPIVFLARGSEAASDAKIASAASSSSPSLQIDFDGDEEGKLQNCQR